MTTRRAKQIKSFLRFAVISGIICTFLGLLAASGLYVYFSAGLPDIITVDDYHPPQVSTLMSSDGQIIGEFYLERRYVIPYSSIPKVAVNAFIAAEDDRFFEHEGLDFRGILRAAIANLRAGRVVQGGSTITQQVAKSLLLSPERSLKRKIQEAILSTRIETNMSKEQILYLYLNQIYLGHGAHGIEAAAQTYFRKSASDLTLPEAAILAGLPQAPSKYSPVINPHLARDRQKYVLKRMFEIGQISQEDYDAALQSRVKVFRYRDINKELAPYFTEHIRKYLLNRYGKDALYEGGLKILATVNLKLQKAAQKALKEGLREIDKRQGWRGPISKVNLTDKEELVAELKKIRTKFLETSTQYFWIEPEKSTDNSPEAVVSEEADKDSDLLKVGDIYEALITRVDDQEKKVHLLLGSISGQISLENMNWATEPSNRRWKPTLKRISQALTPGDVVLVRFLKKIPNNLKEEKEILEFSLEQTPIVQGAIVSIDSQTGHVAAMVGGYDFAQSEFNRAIQSLRQPGSAYKPFIFASALEAGYTPASILVDSPESLEGAEEQLSWKPSNYDGLFKGEITLRQSLEQSRNIPTLKLFMDIGLKNILMFNKRIGIEGKTNEDLSLALGSLSVSPFEITKAYATFPRGGLKVAPSFILKVEDASGNSLESYLPGPEPLAQILDANPPSNNEEEPAKGISDQEQDSSEPVVESKTGYRASSIRFDDPKRVLDEKVAFLMVNLLRGVIENPHGTGGKARALNRPLGGKTGTTNDYIDAWFMGFSKRFVTGVWTGHDEQISMGYGETGARAALPIWMDYMNVALEEEPFGEFQVPPGIVFVPINRETGALAKPGSPNAFLEAFIAGTEPTSSKPTESEEKSSLDFFRQDLDQ